MQVLGHLPGVFFFFTFFMSYLLFQCMGSSTSLLLLRTNCKRTELQIAIQKVWVLKRYKERIVNEALLISIFSDMKREP